MAINMIRDLADDQNGHCSCLYVSCSGNSSVHIYLLSLGLALSSATLGWALTAKVRIDDSCGLIYTDLSRRDRRNEQRRQEN